MTTHNPDHPLSIAVLISGSGSNLQALIDAIAIGRLAAKICVVVSNKEQAYGLVRAQQAGIPTQVILPRHFKTREDYDQALQVFLDGHQPELIILAGFMRILSPGFIQHYSPRILNIHPSLLPKYPGLHTHQQVLTANDALHGATVHVVTDDLDSGPIVAQATTQVNKDDHVDSLIAKVHHLEHQLFPEVIQWYAQGRLRLTQDSVFLDNKKLPDCGLQVSFNELLPD